MSSHPNAILMVALTPDDLPSKTKRELCARSDYDASDEQIKIGDDEYYVFLMDGDWHEGFEVSAKEGDIVLIDFVTYGRGEKISWAKLVEQKEALEAWAKVKCELHKCAYEIFITANYW